MMHDPIVEEVHRIREKMLAEYGGDLRALLAHMQRRTEEAARAGRKGVVARPPRRPEGWQPPAATKKAS